MATYTPNYNLSKPEANDNFDAFRASYGGNMDIIDNNLGGGGGGGGGNYYLNTIYSTEEKRVGYWTDGKPLYQRTVHISALPSSATSQQYAHNISDIDQICHYQSISRASSGTHVTLNRVAMNGSSLNGSGSYDVFVNKTYITISVGQDRSAIEADVTIQYTKTTDTADPNPQTGGVIYLPSIYSTEEREIGCWTDGKPLYQKTVHISALPDSSHIGQYVDYPHGIADVENIIDYEGLIRFSNGTSLKFVRLGFTISAFTPSTSIDSYCNQTNIRIMCGSDRSSASADYTIWYTKTTDVAGSGTWTPSGVPSVHYSTNEQVIGTWIDGKTLYEQVLPITQAFSCTVNTWVETEFAKGTKKALYKAVIVNDAGAVIDSLSGGFVNNNVALNSPRAFNIGANTASLILQYTKTTD